MISLKRFFHWLGVEANARAITVLLAIGAATGALPYFIWDRVLPTYSPALAGNEFGEGYRRGKREAALELTIQKFAAQFKIMEASEAIKNEIENMSDEELKTALRDKLKKGTF